MAKAFRRAQDRYVAHFEPDELTIVVMLLEQTRELLHVPDPEAAPTDEFEHLMRSAGWRGAERDDQGAPVAASPGTDDEMLDPALRRLLPEPNVSDPQASAEFRRLTGTGLRERKAATIAAAIEALTASSGVTSGHDAQHSGGSGRRRQRPADVTVSLDRAQAQAVTVALTDVRLVLGERLELTTEDDTDDIVHRLEHSLDPADPLVAMAFAYDFLTWLQESLAEALLD